MFKSRLRRLSVFLALAVAAGSMMTDQTETQADEGAKPVVTFETSHGSFAVALEPESAPKTVENFLAYVRAGHYDGTIFHRIIAGFMIQGGGYDERYQQLSTQAPIENEAPDAPGNDRGTIAMARSTPPPAQFFINVADNDFSHSGKNPQGWLCRVRRARQESGPQAALQTARPLPRVESRGHPKDGASRS